MNQRALPSSAGTHDRQHLSALYLKTDVVQNFPRPVAISVDANFRFAFIRERNIVEGYAVGKRRQRNGISALSNFVPGIHKAEDRRRSSHRLLKIVVEEREFPHRIVKLENCHDKSQERSGG